MSVKLTDLPDIESADRMSQSLRPPRRRHTSFRRTRASWSSLPETPALVWRRSRVAWSIWPAAAGFGSKTLRAFERLSVGSSPC